MLLLNKDRNSYQQIYLELLCAYTQLPKYNNVQIVKVTEEHARLLKLDILPKYLSPGNETLYSLQEITRNLLQEINCEKLMLGANVSEVSNSNQYFELVNEYKGREGELAALLNDELKGKMFLNGNTNLHACDLAVFAFLMSYMHDLDNDGKIAVPDLYRWFNYLQNLNGVEESVKSMGFVNMEQIQWGLPVDKKKLKQKQKEQKKLQKQQQKQQGQPQKQQKQQQKQKGQQKQQEQKQQEEQKKAN